LETAISLSQHKSSAANRRIIGDSGEGPHIERSPPLTLVNLYVNGREKDTRSFGKLPIIWTCNLFLWITQTLQELTNAFTKFFILGNQYLDRVKRTTN